MTPYEKLKWFCGISWVLSVVCFPAFPLFVALAVTSSIMIVFHDPKDGGDIW